LEEKSNLIVTFAMVLYVNGQATEEIMYAVTQLGRTLGLDAKLLARWGELELHCEDKGGD